MNMDATMLHQGRRQGGEGGMRYDQLRRFWLLTNLNPHPNYLTVCLSYYCIHVLIQDDFPFKMSWRRLCAQIPPTHAISWRYLYLCLGNIFQVSGG